MAELRSVASTARPAILIPAWILDTPPSAAGTSSAVNCPAATSGASVERRPNHEVAVEHSAGSQPDHGFRAPDGSGGSPKDTSLVNSVFARTTRVLSDTGGHGTYTVRDREAPGSNPGPPTNF